MNIQEYLAMALALITALIAIKGETWDTNKSLPTKVGWVATGFAIATFVVGIWGLKNEQELAAQTETSAVAELVVSLNLVNMELLGYQHSLAFSSTRPDTQKLRQQCGYSSDVVTRHRDVFYPELRVAVSVLKSACDISIGPNMTWDESESMVSRIRAVKDEVCLQFGHEYWCK